MSYAIIGFGKIGHALAKAFARNGIEVSVATTRDPESFASAAAAIGPTIIPKKLAEAVKADIIFLAVRFERNWYTICSLMCSHALELRELVRWRHPGSDRPAGIPSVADAQALYLWLSQPGPIEPAAEREAGRNLEVMWLTGRLVPDHKTIADFRKDNGPAIKKVCAQFVALCRKMGLLAKAIVAIDGSKFKAVNSRDNNFTKGKMERRVAQIEESVARYLSQLDTADRQTASGEAPSEELVARTTRLKEKLIKLEEEVKRLKAIEKVMLAAPDQQSPSPILFRSIDQRRALIRYNVQAPSIHNHLSRA